MYLTRNNMKQINNELTNNKLNYNNETNNEKEDIIQCLICWEQATNQLFTARLKRVKSMEFLMKALIGIETGNSIPTGNLYSELRFSFR